MRVIAGTAKGRKLQSPKGKETRPTLDRVREALFSIVGREIVDANVLDLFAGTGAIGIEALSRGAASCHFVENDPDCISLIGENLRITGLEAGAQIHRATLPDALESLASDNVHFDFIYADPPYPFEDIDSLIRQIAESGLLRDTGFLVVEHKANRSLIEEAATLQRFREAKYGSTCLSFYEHQRPEK